MPRIVPVLGCVVFGLAGLPANAQDFLSFRSPTGNIGCYIATGQFAEARCDLRQYTPSFPRRPASCDLDYGMAFVIGPGDGRGQVACVGDTALDPGAVVLGYGQQISLGGLTCWSDESGMTCTNAAGHGFKVARRGQSVF
jgi:hypothetical protein